MEYRATLIPPPTPDATPTDHIPAVNQTFHPTAESARIWADKVLTGNPGARVAIESREWRPAFFIGGTGK